MQPDTLEIVNKNIQVTLRLTTDEHKRWSETAEAQGLALATWIRQQCNGVAPSVLVDALARRVEGRILERLSPTLFPHLSPEAQGKLVLGMLPTEEDMRAAELRRAATIVDHSKKPSKKGGR